MSTTATTAGVTVHEPTIARTTDATNSFTLSESTATSTTSTTRTTPLEGQVAAEREHVIADVKETQAGQFNAVDDLSHKLENTQAATEGLFARDLPAEVGTERAADPVGAGVVLGSTSTANTITLPATGQQLSNGLPAGVTLVQTVTTADTTSSVPPA